MPATNENKKPCQMTGLVGRIQRRRTKGWRLPPNTVCVSRPSKWGNPYRGVDAVSRYRLRLEQTPSLREDARRELRGKNLACWCPTDGLPCHADVLLEVANL